MVKNLLQSRAAQRVASAVIAAYIRFAIGTTRWTLEGGDNLAPFIHGGAVIAAFWHECLPLMPALFLRVHRENGSRQAFVLISQHRDGALISAVMARLGIGVVHGSSARPEKGKYSKGGASALRALIRALSNSHIVVITPDGPRGPAYRAAAGFAQAAAMSGAPILPCAARCTRFWRIASWDRMILPLPFGRGALVCGRPIYIDRKNIEEGAAAASDAMTSAAHRTEALCGLPA